MAKHQNGMRNPLAAQAQSLHNRIHAKPQTRITNQEFGIKGIPFYSCFFILASCSRKQLCYMHKSVPICIGLDHRHQTRIRPDERKKLLRVVAERAAVYFNPRTHIYHGKRLISFLSPMYVCNASGMATVPSSRW